MLQMSKTQSFHSSHFTQAFQRQLHGQKQPGRLTIGTNHQLVAILLKSGLNIQCCAAHVVNSCQQCCSALSHRIQAQQYI